jgi:hypothetical protein
MTGPLVCPSCEKPHADHERFCDVCGLPLVQHGELPPRSELALRARKIRPGYAEGPLVRAAWVPNQAEAELVQGLLLEEGIPSLARRHGGFDVPDFLAGGPRDILVAASGLEAARELLGDPGEGRRLPPQPHPAWMRALAVTLTLIVLIAVAGGVAELA